MSLVECWKFLDVSTNIVVVVWSSEAPSHVASLFWKAPSFSLRQVTSTSASHQFYPCLLFIMCISVGERTSLQKVSAEEYPFDCHEVFCVRHLGTVTYTRSRDSSVGVASGYRLDDRGIGVWVTLGESFSRCLPDWFWGPHILLFLWY
jgi:hypothetical protein